jgi:hypothetical protein
MAKTYITQLDNLHMLMIIYIYEFNSFLVDNSTMLSQADCIRQTTNVHNTSQPHSIGETTVSSSISTFTGRTQHHHSTEIRKTVDKGKDSCSKRKVRYMAHSA